MQDRYVLYDENAILDMRTRKTLCFVKDNRLIAEVLERMNRNTESPLYLANQLQRLGYEDAARAMVEEHHRKAMPGFVAKS